MTRVIPGLAEMEEAAQEAQETRIKIGGNPAVASLQGAHLVAATLWRVCAEICGRLDDAEEANAEARNLDVQRQAGPG